MELLTQNSKMKKSSQNNITVVNWTIPAFQSKTGLKTCPNAGLCAVGCYARSGTYMFGNVRNAHEAKLTLSQSESFVTDMICEINHWLKKRNVKHLKVRIHDAGDFYSKEYACKWFEIMRFFENNECVSFYAYSKQVEMFKEYQRLTFLPKNFTLIYSMGGKQDHLINFKIDRHARVFESLQELKDAGYQDGTIDDMVAAIGASNKIGLVYHGAKNYSSTAWSKVA